MKKLLTLIIVLCATATVRAQSLNSENMTVSTDSTNVSVSFTTQIGRKAAPAGKTVVYAPVITDGERKVSLPAIVVQGKRAARAWDRHEWAAKNEATYENGIYTANGRSIDYSASVPFQPWMHEARIELETVTAGCCSSSVENSLFAANILPLPVVVPNPEPEIVPEPEPTVIEFLQTAFSFVLPASEFDESDPIRFYDDERDNALTIYYRVNKHDIEKGFSGNEQSLTNLVAAIKTIRDSGEADVERVVVAGFASPEGRLEVNDRLAWERAVSVKEYIVKNTDMRDEAVMLFNGSADWRGLRLAVEADPNVPMRAEVLDIIDNVPIWDAATQTGRQTRLRNLGGGAPYKYLSEKIFPLQRNGTFIRVYFQPIAQ